MKDIVMLGGPNGAGKTTAAKVLLGNKLSIYSFVNADEIARKLTPRDGQNVALEAGRIMLDNIRSLIKSDQSFVFETTCAGRSYQNLLKKCKQDGWRLTLLYLWLPSPEKAIERVARRVRDGGHDIPRDVIIRRYWGGILNMREIYLPMSDVAAIYDNSDDERILIAERTASATFAVRDQNRWALIQGPTV